MNREEDREISPENGEIEDNSENGEIPKKKVTISVSTGTIVKIIAIVGLVVLLWYIVDILVAVFLAIVIAAALDPVIDRLEERKIPRIFSSIIIYAIGFGIVALAVWLIIPPIVEQVRELAANLPVYFGQLSGGLEQLRALSGETDLVASIANFLNSLSAQLGQTAAGAFAALGSFIGSAVAIVTVVVVSFYLTLQEKALEKLVRSMSPKKYEDTAIELTRKIQEKMGAWLRGQLLLGLIIFGITYVGLTIMGVEYALTLALIAGILELIPIVGPVIAAIPAVILAFVQEPILALAVLVFFIAVQQFENHVLVPKIMQRAVGLNPVIVIVVILIGAQLLGVLGALVAVPLTTAIAIFMRYYFDDFYKRRGHKQSSSARERSGRFFDRIVR
jgi:predicted PurR-regulated permease PerM